mmetsp:Transcript_15841/g.15822  ORF Transcript_15841/g.15822 Transcript_15841/m.15822 type:complete len:303 (-) Transcript_15841:1199-2107(-)
MRISPVYKLVFQQVMNMWEQSFKEQALKINPKAQCDIAFCGVLENMPNCCSGLLTPMNVGRVFYYSDREILGPRLSEASLTDANDLYNNYTVSDIANYKELSPYQQCIMLAVGAVSTSISYMFIPFMLFCRNNLLFRFVCFVLSLLYIFRPSSLFYFYPQNDYATKNPSWQPTNAVVGFKELCLKPMCNFTEGYCGLCSEFVSGEEATAVVSCTGYDTAADTQTVRALIGLASEVVNIAGVTYLYLVSDWVLKIVQHSTVVIISLLLLLRTVRSFIISLFNQFCSLLSATSASLRVCWRELR